ncbi:MAG: 4-N-acetylglucosaminyltransferase [Pelagibacterales bacterium]|nr:4-N-acetylglucosaminyltransferase [Pelagibacterales bacterium]
MFFDEELLLEIRLNELDKFVHKFVITESTYTHSGKPKKLIFDIKKYSKFKDKIIHIIVDKEPNKILDIFDSDNPNQKNSKYIMNAIHRENYQRNYLAKGLKKAEPDDIVLISDLDEIPNLKYLDLNKIKNNLILFKQVNFYYKFNLYLENFNWYGAKGCKFKNFKSPQWLRNIKSKKYPFWRFDTIFSKTKSKNVYFVDKGGWHFSYFKDAKGIEEKLKSYLHHREYDLEPLGLDGIKSMVENNIPVYNLKTDMRKSKFTGSKPLKLSNEIELPSYIKNNIDKFKEWFV